MAGIELIKRAAKAIIELGEKLEVDLQDGKFTWVEGLSLFIGTAPEAFSLIQQGPALKEEFADLDAAERKELLEYIAAELDLQSDKVEGLVEMGLNVLNVLYDLIKAVRAAKTV